MAVLQKSKTEANNSKDSGELIDDLIDEAGKLLEEWENRLTLDNLRLSERYLEGELELLVRLKFIASGNSANFCAVLKYGESLARVKARNIKVGEFDEGNIPDSPLGRRPPIPTEYRDASTKCDDKQEAVFIDVVKVMEFPERIIPTLIGLERIEEAFRSRRHSLYFSSILGFVFVSSLADGKAGLIAGCATAGLDQLPSQMIKSAPQLIQNLSDCHGDYAGDRGADLHPIASLSGLRIMLDSQSIRIDLAEGLQPAFKVTDVLFGPFDFRPDADQPVCRGHGLLTIETERLSRPPATPHAQSVATAL
jgi:hypothetical protein